MQKVFAKKLKNNTFSFFNDDIYHLLNVLKIKENDQIICIYENKKFLCHIINTNPLLALIDNEIYDSNKSYKLDLYQAIIKPKAFEDVIKFSTQLDVDNLFPVLFARSQYQFKNEINRNNAIIKANASLAGRKNLLNIQNSIMFNEMISLLNKYDLVILAYEDLSNNNYLLNNDLINKNNIAIIIGPEGGYELLEIDLLKKLSNIKIIKLTNTILKSELASVYTISIVTNYLLSNKKE